VKLRQITIISLLSMILLLFICGCESDGPVAMYNQKHNDDAPPEITGLEPVDQAVAGVNYITVTGSNFSENDEFNFVYFDTAPAEIVSNSTTSLKVRRPNQSGDSIYVKVAVHGAVEIAEFGPYKIDPVLWSYGNMPDVTEIGSIEVGADGTLFVTQFTRAVIRIDPDETTNAVGNSSRSVFDSKIGPGGRVTMLMNNRRIYNFDFTTNEETEWVRVDKAVSYGDYDQYGNFYAGGIASGLQIIHPDTSFEQIEIYSADTIACVRVYDNHVYLLVQSSNTEVTSPAVAIWKHEITDPGGTLGAGSVVLDWTQTGEFANAAVKTFTFSADGTLYIGTDYIYPVLTYDIQQSQLDVFYQRIIGATASKLVWGNDNYLYMAQGGESWNLLRIDTGTTGAPYYGRGL